MYGSEQDSLLRNGKLFHILHRYYCLHESATLYRFSMAAYVQSLTRIHGGYVAAISRTKLLISDQLTSHEEVIISLARRRGWNLDPIAGTGTASCPALRVSSL
jgi:hypothetical protein